MKKKISMLTAFVLCAASVAVGAAANVAIQEIKAQLRPDFTIKIDGEERTFKNAGGEVVYPILHDGTTYLPIRAIGELMGKTVFWYEEDKRVEFKDTTVTDADVIVSGTGKTDNAKQDKESHIGVEKAKEIALEKAGYTESEVRFERTELDEDDGIWHYEIEFITGGVEYDFDIGAVNGAVLSWEIDHYDKDEIISEPERKISDSNEFISKEKAKEIALEKAGITPEGVIFEDFEIDNDNGIYHYELEFRKDRTEYEIDIAADDGEILSWKVDKND